MPVPRLQRRVDEVKYVVVERTEEDETQEVERLGVAATATPTNFVSPRQDPAQAQPTVLQIRDDDSDSEGKGPPEVV